MKDRVIATILFADLMNSTELAKNLSLQEYDDMLVDFQTTMFEVVSHHLRQYGYVGNGVDSEWSMVGDELRLFLYSGMIPFDVRNALLIAVKIKVAWLTSGFNQKILKEGRLVSRIGVGINCGEVVKGLRGWRMRIGQEQPNVEGYAINLTKRIESASRDGSVFQVMAGDSLHRKSKENRQINATFSAPRKLVFRGLGQRIPVYELVSFVNHEVLTTMPASLSQQIVEKMEYTVSRPMPEPWIYIILLRHYISQIAKRGNEDLETRAIKLAQQAAEVLEYKPTLYNMLGWLYTYGRTVHNLELAFHYFDQSLGLDPTNEAALLHRARILDRLGQMDLARHAYTEILVHNSQHPEALRKVAQYQTM
ncbi:MAG: hypothetical protein JRJ12_06830 [Deltaproteobacteria bacterium]|nr:hypothetical protein [Deltaproteobacteria bacterium]MBW2071109.1 hypothetical protein [Deltaproteobacteria bacterium]